MPRDIGNGGKVILASLRSLARLYGVQTGYYDVSGRRCSASVESLIAVLQALGAPLETAADIPAAYRERRQYRWQCRLEPVTVIWEGKPPRARVRLPASLADTVLSAQLRLETGATRDLNWRLADLPAVKTADVEGVRYVVKQLPLGELPAGYHRLALNLPGKNETLIITAPVSAYIPEKDGRIWGVFIPLYALHRQKGWGAGDFGDLQALMTWVAGLGGGVVATLPFLSTFLDEPFAPSPYTPASRLLWNEFYLDIASIPELARCPRARALLDSPSVQEEVQSLRKLALVDYRRQMALKRRILEEFCQCLFAEPSRRLDDLHQFIKANPVVEDYARFRAVVEKQRAPWRSWSQPQRDGALKETDYAESTRRYHLYVQWLAHEQMQALAGSASQKGQRLYLDLPLGVHPDGYDVWRERRSFVLTAAAGAPPDTMFVKGQNWGFPPLHPERIRELGYHYVIAYLRHHLRYARILRIDHIMSLHRLFWVVPHGVDTRDGVYVRYNANELYAILALESHRHQSIIVGEDLGTVPPPVRPAMRRHGLYQMYVMDYELYSPERALRPVPANGVAQLGTHDMPPFAAFWEGQDIQTRRDVGILDSAGAQRERETRRAVREALQASLRSGGWLSEPADVPAILKACLAFLCASPGRVVLANLEDLWLETQAQNIPSTQTEHPNWLRKARYDFDTFCHLPEVVGTLREMDRLRKQGEPPE